MLLASAVDHRFEWQAGVAVESPYALRPVHLVTCDGQQVYTQLPDVDTDLAGSLTRIRVDQGAEATSDVGYFPDGLECARLAVGDLDRDEKGVLVDCPSHMSRSTLPNRSTPTTTSRNPWRRLNAPQAANTEGCSVACVTMVLRPVFIPSNAAPLIARLLLSEPDAVNTISAGAAPRNVAKRCRARATASLADLPRE
jgi:hypothetical protein